MFWKKAFVMAMFWGLAACGGSYEEDMAVDAPVSKQAAQQLDEDEELEPDDSLNCDWICKCNRKCYRECHATSGSCVMNCRAGC